MNSLETKLNQISALEKDRDRQRVRMDQLLEKRQSIENDIKALEVVLEQLDERLDTLEEDVLMNESTQNVVVKKESTRANGDDDVLTTASTQNEMQSLSSKFSEDQLTEPSPQRFATKRTARVSLETQLTDPNASQFDHFRADDDEVATERRTPVNVASSRNVASIPRSSMSTNGGFGGVGQLEITTVPPKKKRAAPKANGTLDSFLGLAPAESSTSSNNNNVSNNNAASAASQALKRTFGHSNFPWSQEVQQLLRNSFHIQEFREHQKEVINATLSRRDVFVLMRTGGGKSLTYQLPALLEGRGRGNGGKITICISPLLSLIKDQEDQMNQFAPGSAVSFSSSLKGGDAEHARRWNMVQDPRQGVCLVLVTPEKVHKSSKLKHELQKLHQQNRLGRFVVDEAHCSSNWGHDFRPDYTKLGILRTQFPGVPILAVTATASDRVRRDVIDILRMRHDTVFFHSTANRPNLTYEVRNKRSPDSVLDDMASFIKEEFPQRAAGIVYTFSRKDADTVADQLGDRGIVAESYHSE